VFPIRLGVLVFLSERLAAVPEVASEATARQRSRGAALLLSMGLLGGCATSVAATRVETEAKTAPQTAPAPATAAPAVDSNLLPGMPLPLDPNNLYAADGPGMLAPFLRDVTPRVYVPNSRGHTVDVIDPATGKIIQSIDVGINPQHVVPSWDMRTLWVNNDKGNSLTPIDALTGLVGAPVPVHDPYNLYFTPDGKSAVVMASEDRQIVFRDPHTMAIQSTLPVACDGVNHADFSPDGKYMIVTCEFTGELLKVDVVNHTLLGTLMLDKGAMPQDIKIAPDGKVWYVADMMRNGIYTLDGDNFKVTGFIPTGKATHGLFISRDAKLMYISNRGEGSISTFDLATQKLIGKWFIPGGGSPDMGGLNVDGDIMWVSGRYNSVVYEIDLKNWKLLAKIPVGAQPHGLCVWPQPGRYSLGHTGVMR
jgi:YVTN family beta-propeller protein